MTVLKKHNNPIKIYVLEKMIHNAIAIDESLLRNCVY